MYATREADQAILSTNLCISRKGQRVFFLLLLLLVLLLLLLLVLLLVLVLVLVLVPPLTLNRLFYSTVVSYELLFYTW